LPAFAKATAGKTGCRLPAFAKATAGKTGCMLRVAGCGKRSLAEILKDRKTARPQDCKTARQQYRKTHKRNLRSPPPVFV